MQDDAALLRILFDKAVGRFFRHGGDRSRFENVLRAKELLRIAVGLGLELAGDLQDDIRLLIAVEAEEGLKRDFVPVALHGDAAVRAILGWQVVAGADGSIGKKFTVAALRADVVRRKGVYLGDARHRRHERRADGATRADVVAMILRVFHQLLRDDVENGKAVFNDRIQLAREAVGHILWHRISIHLLAVRPADFAQFLLRAGDIRWKIALREGAHHVYHIRNLIRVFHNHLIGPLAEIGKFIEHFLRGAQVERGLVVRIGKALPRHEDAAENFIARVKEMNVARGDHQLAELIAKLEDRPVDLLELFLPIDPALPHEEGIVALGLNFKIIVKRGDVFQLVPRPPVEHGAVELARLARAADQKPFAVFDELAFGDARLAIKIFQVGHRDQPVEIFQPCQVFHQDDLVIGAQLFRIHLRERSVEQAGRFDIARFARFVEQNDKDIRQDFCIVTGAVMVKILQLQIFRYRIELIIFQPL